MNADVYARLWARVDRRGDGECWPFRGAASHGYGILRVGGRKGRNVLATHLVLAERGVTVPRGMVVCHKCDNPRCVNPAHLWVGTQSENLRDMHAKQRGYSRGRHITRCPRGHEYTPDNTRTYKGRRYCRQCDRDRNKDNPERVAAARERNRRLRSLEASRRRAA